MSLMIERFPKEKIAQYPEIEAVYLFGSQAAGTARTDSDYDFAVVLKHGSKVDIKFELLTILTEAGFDEISVVVLDDSDPYLNFQAVKHNKLLFKKPDFNQHEYYSLTVRKYLDIEPYLARQRKELKARMLNG